MPRHRKIGEVEMQAAAYLYSQKYPREEIKKILHLSQSTVSRSIKHAEKEGWLEVNIRFAKEKLSSERMEEIEAIASPQKHLKKQLDEFATKYGGPAPNLRVFPSTNRDMTATDQVAHLESFGQVVAGHIRDLLRPSKVCGVTWGYTLASVVRGLHRLGPPPLQKGNPTEFIPLCGESLDTAGMKLPVYSSSSIAAQFDEIINGGTKHSLSLAAVPALIPRDFTQNKVQAIRELIARVTAYSSIFSKGIEKEKAQHEPWIDKLDTILTGISPAEYPLGYWRDALVTTGRIDRDQLSRFAVGDIGGILFARRDLSKSELVELEKINERWTGIREHQMKRCAAEASQNRTSGVVVVAVGENKAASICESIKRGLVNELVIDRDLAVALAQSMPVFLDT